MKIMQSSAFRDDTIVMAPFDYLQSQPGKNMRYQLILAFNAWLQVPQDSLAIINRVVGMLHTASLMIDDIEDNSLLRRGIPTAHQVFGTAQTINSANFVYFLALQEIQKLGNPEAVMIFTKELLNLHHGQGIELYWRDTLTCPMEAEYFDMVADKTGGLFRLAIKLMQAESSTKMDLVEPDLVELVNNMGLMFQICDDYLNLCDTTYRENKGLYEDLTEGKFSFPIIHAIRANPSTHQLISILKQRTDDEDVKRHAVQYIQSTGSFDYTKDVVRTFYKRSLSLIDQIDAVYSIDNVDGSNGAELVRAVVHKIVKSTLAGDENIH